MGSPLPVDTDPQSTEPVPLWGRPWVAAAACFAVALVIRLVMIALVPEIWHFDGYQRWAGRDHLVIQVWLPATQLIVWTVAKLGGGLMVLRVALALIGAVVVGLGAELSRRLGGPRAGWFFLPMAVFGPFLCWSIVPYQESTFLLLIFGALLLQRRHPLLSDIVMGALALVRYEGWPLVLVHVFLRRKLSGLLALWGMGLWIALKLTGLAEPYKASPDSFADWEGLTDRWTLMRHLDLLEDVWRQAAAAGTPWLLVPAVIMLFRRPWPKETTFLAWAIAGQLAALTGWVAALGQASSRMTVLISMLLGVLAAAELGNRWPSASKRARAVLLVVLLALSAWTARDGISDCYKYIRWVIWEVKLVPMIEACDRDTWSIHPRTQRGIRRRHDGCEVVQGLTELRAGQDFVCETWDWGGPKPTIRATWSRLQGRYLVERIAGEGYEGCPVGDVGSRSDVKPEPEPYGEDEPPTGASE